MSATGADPSLLAARFAAKEATFKVLEVTGDQPVSWRDVEIVSDPSGSVALLLSGNAANLADVAGISDIAVSLTQERDYGAAVVVAEIRQHADK